MADDNATQGVDNSETGDTGQVETDTEPGREASGDSTGSSVPTTLAAALSRPPTSPPRKMVPQEKVNYLKAKAREEGFSSALKELLSRYEIDSEEELGLLVAEGKKIRPAPKDKVVADLEAKLAENERKLRDAEATNKQAAIERATFPLLSDAHKPHLALQAIMEETGLTPFVKADGSVALQDTDGDEVEMTVGHWIKTSKPKVRYLFKATVEAPVTAPKAAKTKAEADAEQRAEEARGADPRYRQRKLGEMIQAAILKTPH